MAEENVVIVRFTEAGGELDGRRSRAVIVSGNVLGDLWDWVVGVFERIGRRFRLPARSLLR